MSKRFLTTREVMDKIGTTNGLTPSDVFATRLGCESIGADYTKLGKYKMTDYPVDDDIVSSPLEYGPTDFIYNGTSVGDPLTPMLDPNRDFAISFTFAKMAPAAQVYTIVQLVNTSTQDTVFYIQQTANMYGIGIRRPDGSERVEHITANYVLNSVVTVSKVGSTITLRVNTTEGTFTDVLFADIKCDMVGVGAGYTSFGAKFKVNSLTVVQ